MEELKQIIKCPLCNNANIVAYLDTRDYFFSQKDFKLTKCSDCYFVFTNPVPTDLGKYYETTDYLSHNTNDNGILGKLYAYLRTINIRKKYKLVTDYKSLGNLLDIGCGTGELLKYFKDKNWSVTGVEPNKTALLFAKNNYDIDIYEESLLDKLPLNSFDIISMWHVLEHVPELHHRITQISNLLKQNGTIFIALPNLDSPDSKKYKELWSALDVPRHLYHFTQSTFKSLISKHGLKQIHAEPMKLDAYYVSMLSEKYKNNSLYLPTAFLVGAYSNLKAKKKNNYSSMIYVVKKT